MSADLLDRFQADLPHLGDKLISAAAGIAEMEFLLDDAEVAGLRYIHAGWISLGETHIVIAAAEAVGWIQYLTRQGYMMDTASFSGSGQDVTAHARHPDGRRLSLTMQNEQAEAAK